MTILYLILLSTLSGCLYRMGGYGKPFDTKYRDFGCPATALIALIFVLKIQAVWWVPFISFGLMFAAFTTYWDFITGDDNFYLHGGMVALACLPYALVGAISWVALVLRVAVLAISVGLWCHWRENDLEEEFGRGVLFIITLPILCV